MKGKLISLGQPPTLNSRREVVKDEHVFAKVIWFGFHSLS